MAYSRSITKENRLIHLQAGYQDAIRKAQAETGLVAPTYTYTPTKQGTVSSAPTSSWTSRGQTVYGYDTALPEKSSPNIVPSGYDINLDPTYAGTMNKELTGWTGGERTSGNVGPTAGFTGTRAEWDAQMAKEADAYANSVVKAVPEGVARDFNAEAMAREQAKAAFYQQKQLEIEKQRLDSERAQRQAGSVGNNLQDAVNNRLKDRLTKLEGTRGDFVDAKRAEVDPKTGQRIYSDQQIKKMLQEMPVGTFSNENPVPQQPQTTTNISPSQTTAQQENGSVQPLPSPTGTTKTAGRPSQDATSPAATTPVTIPVVAQSIGEQMYQIAQQNGDPLAGINKALYDDMILREEQEKRDALLSLGAATQAAEQENADTQSYIDKWVNIATKNSDKLTNLLQTQNDETNKVLEKQKENALQKLAFDKQVETQKLERQKAQDVLKSSIAIALRGGAYSGAAQEALADSERQWDIGIQNLAKEFSFKAADVALEFTSQYVSAKQNLALNLYNASEALSTKIEGYSNAGFASLQAKKSAVASAKSQYKSTIDQIVKDHASELKGMVKTMGEAINKSRDDKRAQEQIGWQRMEWASKTYGSGAPKAIIESIQKQLPGVDVAGTLAAMTLAEMKQKKIGLSGGVSSLSFQPYQMKAGGQPPSFEDFVNEKEKVFLAANRKPSGSISGSYLEQFDASYKAPKFDRSEKAMAEYKKEYETRLAATRQYNPTEITNRFILKAGTLSATSRKYAEQQISEALASGNYKLASDIVDNTGDDVPANQADDFTQALNSRYNVKKLSRLFDEIGTTYPGIGTVRELNPLDDRVKQYKQNLTQTIPGLARGIFKEVGVLTDQDIERYTSTIANPNLTQEQARTAFNDLLERIDVSMQNQINVFDANRKAVKGFRDLYEAEPLTVTPQQSVYDKNKSDFLNSLPR